MTLGGLLFNRRTKRQYRLDGCRESRVKPLLNIARPFLSLLNRQQLPNIVDLRSFLSPIEEQYTLGSCVGNSLASILEYFHYYTTGQIKIFSRLFIYYNARLLEDDVSKRNATETDSGADLQFAIVSLIKYGCCEEQYWPLHEHLINQRPSNDAYKNGQNYCLNEFIRLSNNVNQLRECLAQGYPFVMAIKIFPSFASNHQGYIPMPKKNEKSSQFRHAVVCVGYIHSEKVFIIRNSHGLQWGDHGYGYLPYDYVSDKVLTKDLWGIKSIRNMKEIPIEQHIAWNDNPTLSKSASQPNVADDELSWDIVYSDGNGEREESEAVPPQQQQHHHHHHNNHSQDLVQPQLKYHRDHSAEQLQREFPIQQHQKHHRDHSQEQIQREFPGLRQLQYRRNHSQEPMPREYPMLPQLQYLRNHSQEQLQREFPIPQHQQQGIRMPQQLYMNNFPLVQAPPQIIYTPVPVPVMGGSYPYYQPIFNPVAFYKPY
ncbi:unnamed protein product [Adineta steineri]|uniref:Peptidase C1A papain C-terminal domain-containing protein n=1 Tax=Adineta steineri TaxID=433720 RepID=A0A814QG55_9BILA|nr:unnamed protein product [Adineta steineri]CAF3858230.1 unnamed protein product [Adineta steineri]